VRAIPEHLEITGDPGEVNVITLRHDLDREVVRVEDRVALILVAVGGRACTSLGAMTAECPYPAGDSFRRFVIDLGDRDDRLAIVAERTSPETYAGLAVFSEVRDGPGDDRASSIPTTTNFVTGPGNDVLRGASTATPSGGNDTITGTVGPDLLEGGRGRDVIRGADGADVIRGGPSADRLFGESGQDRLFGGGGNDFLRGGSARDRLSGGPGRNVLIQG
jgi:Ca2+-binding RTX toxin-like protein